MSEDKPALPKDPARKKNVQNFIFWTVIVVLLGASGYLLVKAFGGSNPVKKEEQKQEEVQKEEQKTENTEETTPEVAGTKYVVKDGDTLYSIAIANGVTMDALQKTNNLDDPNKLKIGQELIIPEKAEAEKTESTDGGTTSGDKDTP